MIGYRFSPTGEEVINHYLKNKILGKTWLVDEAISEINILSYIPELLPRLAKIRSDDLNWYFFNRIEYMSPNSKAMKRTTVSGYWKPTGKNREIKGKRGNGDKIGFKKTLVYHEGKVPNGVRTLWVMHEYHITCLPPNQRTFVVCQVKYKGEHKDISYGNNSSDTKVAQSDEGMSMNDLSIPLNEKEEVFKWDEYLNPNLFMENNNKQQSLYLTGEVTEFVSQTDQGMSMNDLSIPLNEIGEVFEWYQFVDNKNPYVQEKTPDLTGEDKEFVSEFPTCFRGILEDLFSDQVVQETYKPTDFVY